MFWRAGKLPNEAQQLVAAVSDPDLSHLRAEGEKVEIPVGKALNVSSVSGAEEGKVSPPQSTTHLPNELQY